MIAVTGANGFLGSNICTLLSQRGIDFKPLTKRLSALDSSDLCGADVVIHCAARIPDLNNLISDYYDVNYYGTLKVLQLAEKNGVDKFVYISSMSAIAEGYYESSKRLSEYLVRSSSIPWLILRPSHIFGPNDYTSKYIGLLSKRKHQYMIGSSNRLVFNVYINDCVKSILAATFSPHCNKIFNITNKPMTQYHFLRVLRRAIGMNYLIVTIPEYIARIRYGKAVLDSMIRDIYLPGIPNWDFEETDLYTALRLTLKQLGLRSD